MLPVIKKSSFLWVVVFFAFLLPCKGTAVEKIYRVGVLALRGTEKAEAMWGPTADYLTHVLPGTHFEITVLGFSEMYTEMARQSMDFVIANPGMYIECEALFGARPLATLLTNRLGKPYTTFGGIIFRRTDRTDLTTLSDLKQKRFMAVDETSLGGWQMQWRELKEAGINPYHDFSRLLFGGSHDEVVLAVQRGEVDAGAVRTDTLEQMESEGKIVGTSFVVLHPQQVAGFPFRLSTRLYPEWPFIAGRHVDESFAKKVAIALMQMPADHPAAKATHSSGWTVPENYEPVHAAFRVLRLGPYRNLGKITPQTLLEDYLSWTVGVVTAFFVLVFSTIAFLIQGVRKGKQINEVLRRSEEQTKHYAEVLESYASTLEKQVSERTSALVRANSEISLLNERLSDENRRITAELDIVHQLQYMILPKEAELSTILDLDIAVHMKPAGEIGGDYYDVLCYEDQVVIGIGDVTGHGLESGVIMLMVQAAVRTLTETGIPDLKQSLITINHVIYKNRHRMETDRNLSLAILHYTHGQLRITGQHEEVLVVRQGKIERVDTLDLGFPIGLERDISPFVAEYCTHLDRGDIIILYTDGITESENPLGEFFGLDRLCRVVTGCWTEPASVIRESLVKSVNEFVAKGKIHDDATLLVLKRRNPRAYYEFR